MRVLHRLVIAGLFALGLGAPAFAQPATQQFADRAVTAPCTAACDISVRTNGSATVAVAASGSGSGLTFVWQGQSADGTWVTLPAFNEGTQTASSANLSANGQWLLASSGYLAVRGHLSAIGGGTETLSLNASAAPRSPTIATGPNGGSLPAEQQISGTAASATSLVWTGGNAYLDVSGYAQVGLHFTSIGAGNTITVEGSDDTAFTNAVVYNAYTINSQVSLFAGGTIAPVTTNNYAITVNFKYLRLRISTFGSGTVTAVAQLKAAPFVSPIVATYGSLQPANTTNSSGGQLTATATLGNCDDTSPPAVTENNFGPVRMDCAMRTMQVSGGCNQQASVAITAGSTTQVIALSGSTVIRVCSMHLTMATTGTWTVLSGTGSNCGTPANAVGTMNLTAGTPGNIGDGTGVIYRGSSGGELCFTATTGNLNGWVTYSQL